MAKFFMDLKHFKKTGEDKHHTTLRHDKGHEFRLAHNALSPEMAKQLKSIPVHQGDDIKDEINPGKMATAYSGEKKLSKGGEIEKHKGHSMPHPQPPEPKKMADGGQLQGSNDWDKGFNSGGPSAAEAWDGIKTAFDSQPQPKQKPRQYYRGTPAGGVDEEDAPVAMPSPAVKAAINEVDPEEDLGAYTGPQKAQLRTPEQIAKFRADTYSYKNEDPSEDTANPITADVGGEGPLKNAKDYAPTVNNNREAVGGQQLNQQPQQTQEDPNQRYKQVYESKYRELNDSWNRQHAKSGEPAPEQQLRDQALDYAVQAKKEEAYRSDQAKIKNNAQDLTRQNNMKELGIAPTPTAPPQGAEVGPSPASGPEETPQQQPQQQDPYMAATENLGQQQYEANMRRTQAAELTAKADQAQMEATALAQQKAINETQDYLNTYKSHIDGIRTETHNIAHDLANGHIDPDHYWNSKTTPQRLKSGIGILLSGLGAGSAGQENGAMKYLQSQINADIEGQKHMMNVKGNVLNSLLHQYGDEAQALQAFNVSKQQVLANEISKAASAQGNPRAEAIKQAALADIGERIAKDTQGLATARMLFNSQGANGADNSHLSQQQEDSQNAAKLQHYQTIASINPDSPQGKQAKALAERLENQWVPGVGTSSRTVDKDTRGQLLGIQQFMSSAQRYKDFVSRHPYGSWTPADKREAASLTGEMQGAYRVASKGGTYKEGEQHFLEGQIGNAGDILAEYKTSPQIDVLTRKAMGDFNLIKKAAGFPVKAPIPTYQKK